MTCKRIEIAEFGGPNVLGIVEEEILPEPGSGKFRMTEAAKACELIETGQVNGKLILEVS